MKPTFVRLNRRDVLRMASSGVSYAALARLAEGTAQASGPIGPTTIENLQPGTARWMLTKAARGGEIEGYANATSVNRGGSIKFFVNTQDPNFKIEFFRMGWYNGLGSRKMGDGFNLPGIQQPPAVMDSNTNLIECPWSETYTLNVPYDAGDPTVWASGYYLAKLTALPSNWQTFIPFVVRDDQRNSDFLMQSSVTTFQAYNTYGGKCMYDYLSPGGRSRKVSFNRPYRVQSNSKLVGGCGAAEFVIGGDGGPPAGWEYNMVRFLEREGFDVSYCTNIDTHTNPNLLLGHKGFLSVGHDEYWSWEMRQNVTQARDAGVCLGFFSANSVYWQIRLEPSPLTGEANRTIVCYKFSPRDYQGDSSEDPYYLDGNPNNDHLITITWRGTLPGSSRQSLPEEQLLGTQYEFGADRVNAAMVCVNPNHWVYAGTGLVEGGVIPGVIGYEADRMHGSSPSGTVLLARSPHNGNSYVGNSYSDMTLYQAGSGAFVYATGSVQWAYGLDDFNPTGLRTTPVNAAAQQMTRNVLSAMTQIQRTGLTLAQAKPSGPYSNLLGEATVFDGSASHGANSSIDRYIWDFGDGTGAEGVNPSHTHAAPGSYVVKLTIIDNKGNSDDSLTSVAVHRLLWRLEADSTWDKTFQGQRFFYPPSGLNDGIIPIPTPTDLLNQWFSAGGRAMDSAGLLTTPINVYGYLLRRSTLSSIRVHQSAYNQGSQFRTCRYRVYTRITGGNWQLLKTNELPDAHRVAQDTVVPNHQADEIRIEILSGYDLINKSVGLSEIQIGTLEKPLNALPVIVTNDPYSGDEGQLITFNSRSSYDPDGTIISWFWEFGDGATANVAKTFHAYEREGSYKARITLVDDQGNIAAKVFNVTIKANRRYKTVTADSTFDVTTGGKRYFYPAAAVGDYVVPSSTTDIFKQWFAASNRPMNTNGVLNTPVNVFMTFFDRQTVNRIRVTQAWYTEDRAFCTRNFAVYVRLTGGAWEQVGAGVLQPAGGSWVDVSFQAREADEARIEIMSTWDTTTNKSVGLAEVEVFSGTEAGNQPPVAKASVPEYAAVNEVMTLDGTGSSDSDGTLVSYEWAFSDGTSLSGATVQKTYATPTNVAGTLTVTDNAGAKGTTSFELTARTRFRSVSATSIFDQTSGGKRYRYPPLGMADYVIPVPTAADLFNQWFSEANLPHTEGVLTTPVTVTIRLWENQSISQATLYQACYTDGKGFNAKAVKVYVRLGNVDWIPVAEGTLPNIKGAALALNFPATVANQVRVDILSTWDLVNKGVGLSEVEIS